MSNKVIELKNVNKIYKTKAEEIHILKNVNLSFSKGNFVSIQGKSGSGKTTFTKFLGKNLGIGEDITSPTFNLVNLYSGKFEFNHMDLYRIDSPEELYQIDYENYFYPDGVTVIEWAENGGYLLPKNLIEIEILKVSENSRKIVIKGNNKRELEIIEGL